MASPEDRPAQRALALEVTSRVHGRDVALEAERRSREVFSGGLLEPDEWHFAKPSPSCLGQAVPADALATAAATAVASGAVRPNGEARRLIARGGLYVNDVRVAAAEASMPAPVHGRYWVLRTGKKNLRIVERATDLAPPIGRDADHVGGLETALGQDTSAW